MNSAERREARYQRRKAARMKKKAAALREYGDFETVFSFERLYESYRASVRGVGWKASTQRYKAASLANVTKTHEELIAGRYRSKGFYEFDIVERGKPRHIRSVHISERVVQRCLCDYCLVPMLSRSFIYDNGASLRGKGYDFAVSRVTHFLAEHYRKRGREGYVLVFDFSKYFDTAQHEPVFREFERSGIDDRLVSLSKYFIQNFGDVGLGLGSQVSQIAALALPNRIDHYIKDVLGMKYYARYMDDGCIISESKEKLEICLRELRRLCAEHGIRLNPKKTQIIKLTRIYIRQGALSIWRKRESRPPGNVQGYPAHEGETTDFPALGGLRQNDGGGRGNVARLVAGTHEAISFVPHGADRRAALSRIIQGRIKLWSISSIGALRPRASTEPLTSDTGRP